MSLSPIGIPPLALPDAERPAGGARAAEAAPEAPRAERADARSLWEMLTPGEREFFQRLETLGPLTYRRGPARAPDATAPTGQRIDVKG